MPRVIRSAQPGKVALAHEQRREPTAAEAALSEALRGNRLGARFRRQHLVGDFVLDFCCAAARFAVELDVEPHERQQSYDNWRDGQLEMAGIHVLRPPSHGVHADLEAVLTNIRTTLTTEPTQP